MKTGVMEVCLKCRPSVKKKYFNFNALIKAEPTFAPNRKDGDSSFDREGGLESDGIVAVVEINVAKRSREIKGGSGYPVRCVQFVAAAQRDVRRNNRSLTSSRNPLTGRLEQAKLRLLGKRAITGLTSMNKAEKIVLCNKTKVEKR